MAAWRQRSGAEYLGAMSAVIKRPATFADLEDLPAQVVGEIVRGELFVSPRPAIPHALAASCLGIELGPFHRGRGGPGGWWILYEPELHLADDVLVPDLAGWKRSRLPVLPQTAAFVEAPDWPCEVLAPSTARVDLQFKLPAYATAGVEFAWIIDPIQRSLQAFRCRDGKWVLQVSATGNERVRLEPFEAIELELATLWEE